MEFEQLPGGSYKLVLSRRNLLTLLAKLDEPYSHRTLYKMMDGPGSYFIVTAEEDSDHYIGRSAGPMSPLTEATLKEYQRVKEQ